MTIEEALKHFSSGYEICKTLKISQSNFTRWKAKNFIPLRQQMKINEVTGANMPIDIDKQAMEERIGRKDI